MTKRAIGWGVLVFGTAGLGLWASLINAPRIENYISALAESHLQELGADKDVALTVSGRDITVTGFATNDGGAAAILAALDQIKGRRVLRSDLADLAVAAPYVMVVTKDGGLMTATGYVPSNAARARLAPALGDGAGALELARGAPEEWEANVTAGLAALSQLEKGTLRLEGQTVVLQGVAKTPTEAKAAGDALANVALLIKDITLLDDGLPIAYQIVYSAEDGGRVQGKLPVGASLGGIATALGVAKMAGDASVAQLGEVGDMSYLSAWAEVLPQIETLTAEITPDARRVQTKLLAGADAAAVAAALATGGFAVGVEETIVEPVPAAPAPQPDAPRVSPLGFEISQAGCQGASDALLAETTIIFLPNEDTLDASAAAVLDNLAAIARDCAGGDLRAEIGGHTDTSGDATENLALSARRAETVRAALIAEGVPEGQLTAKGYGDAQPIADNATKEGRIQNRRTTVSWSQ